MSPSIAKREKLFGPLQLALIGVLFAVSFFYLLPRHDAFNIAEPEQDEQAGSVIGELDLAYLKARSASGEPSVQETSRAVVALVRTGQIEAAQQLLDQQPAATIGAQHRFALDMEMARVEFFAAETEKQRESKRLQLLNRIELLIADPSLRTDAHLQNAVLLSEQLNKPSTTIALYQIIAEQDSVNSSAWYKKCAQASVQQKNQTLAATCLNKAIASAPNADALFDLRLAQLSLVSATGNRFEQDAAIDALRAHQPLNNSQSLKLAEAMLANERSDLAFIQYEKLSNTDAPNRKRHLLNAAKWAEASNEPLAAASYIDQAADLSTGSEKVTLLERAERLLVAAGENDLVFKRLVARIDERPDDEQLLQQGIVLAQQFGKLDQAAKWNEQLVRVSPTNLKAVTTQIDLALASRNLTSAAKWSRHAVALSPESRDVRVRHAQISEWNGNPVAALREWQWIAANYPEKDNLAQLVRLAELNREAGIAALAMRKLLNFAPDDNANIARLVKLYELEGKPLSAASMLNELQRDYGLRAFTQRELARLYQRHILYPEALVAWNVYAESFGQSSEATLNRMELHWRLNQLAEAAKVARELVGTSHISEASRYQVQLLSEIAWRYRMPELAQLVKPHMAAIEDEYQSTVLGKRLVQSLEDAGKDEQAVQEATRLWQTTGSSDIAFTAMNLAFKTGNTEGVSALLSSNEQTAELREKPAYWTLAASIHQKNGNTADALRAFETALKLDPTNVSALSGLLWAHIDANNVNAIATFIEQHQALAEQEPELWSPFAIAHLQLGLPELSLTWFDRQLDRIEADYNMLLTFADALEYAGRAEPARKVRLYAIRKLRPVLADGSSADKEDLLRQYAQLLYRYGSAEDKERLAQQMLEDASVNSASRQFWREDIAISWLMATQRHEHARLVMAKLHEKRLQAPAWQELALAMANKNVRQIHEVLDGTGSVSIGNHILALRQVGRDKDAYKLASSAINRAPTLSDRELARSQFSAMRSERPSYSSGVLAQTSMNGLAIEESGFTIRHSFRDINLGWAFDYRKRSYSSDLYALAQNNSHADVALTLHHGNRRFGGLVTAGYRETDSDELTYALSKHHLRNGDGTRTLSAELAYNEDATDSAILRLAAKQSRATLAYEQDIGFREYFKVQANFRDISTRVEQNRVARGLSARMELGIRGAVGSNVWSTSVAAARVQNDIVSTLPDDLAIAPDVTIDNLLSDRTTSLSVGASLSRGGVAGEYPQASSPRYYLNANIGRTWPNATFGAQFDAGAGIRILGGDELSVGFSHDTQPFSGLGKENDTTRFGVNYRYHF